jgi:hypothetical protein
VSASYRLSALYRPQILVAFAIFAAFAGWLLVRLALGRLDAPLWFVLLWIGAVGWNAYWFLLRLCYRLDLDDRTLRWWAPLRRGEIPLDQLREIRPYGFGTVLFVPAEGRPAAVLVRRGVPAFVAAVQEAAPHVRVTVNRYSRVLDRLPGPSGFRRGTGGRGTGGPGTGGQGTGGHGTGGPGTDGRD